MLHRTHRGRATALHFSQIRSDLQLFRITIDISEKWPSCQNKTALTPLTSWERHDWVGLLVQLYLQGALGRFADMLALDFFLMFDNFSV